MLVKFQSSNIIQRLDFSCRTNRSCLSKPPSWEIHGHLLRGRDGHLSVLFNQNIYSLGGMSPSMYRLTSIIELTKGFQNDVRIKFYLFIKAILTILLLMRNLKKTVKALHYQKDVRFGAWQEFCLSMPNCKIIFTKIHV